MSETAFNFRRFHFAALGCLALAACPGGDPEPAGTPVTEPAPDEPKKTPALVVPADEDKPEAAANEADPDPPEVQ